VEAPHAIGLVTNITWVKTMCRECGGYPRALGHAIEPMRHCILWGNEKGILWDCFRPWTTSQLIQLIVHWLPFVTTVVHNLSKNVVNYSNI
jgi:hypothetical protein